MTFRIIAIRKGYTPLHALPAETTAREAHRALVEWSTKRHIQATPAPHLSWLCGHRKPRAGGKLRAGMLWRCVDCANGKA